MSVMSNTVSYDLRGLRSCRAPEPTPLHDSPRSLAVEALWWFEEVP